MLTFLRKKGINVNKIGNGNYMKTVSSFILLHKKKTEGNGQKPEM